MGNLSRRHQDSHRRHRTKSKRVFGSIRRRHFAPRPLLENGSVKSESTTIWNGEVGYGLTDRTRLTLEVFSLFDSYPATTNALISPAPWRESDSIRCPSREPGLVQFLADTLVDNQRLRRRPDTELGSVAAHRMADGHRTIRQFIATNPCLLPWVPLLHE